MTKHEVPKFFNHISEIESRDTFDPSSSVSPENFQSLVGLYKLPDNAKCQVRRQEGNCGHLHRRGYLGLTTDGKEVLVGKDCGKKYFKADERYSDETKRIEREHRITINLRKLEDLLSEPGKLETQLGELRSRLKAVREGMREFRGFLPASVDKTLEEMSKKQDGRAYVQLLYQEKDENGKLHQSWQDTLAGTISGVGLWRNETYRPVFLCLKTAMEALPTIQLSRSAGDKRLANWTKCLQEGISQSDAVRTISSQYERLIRTENVALMSFLTRTTSEQEAVLALALRDKKSGLASNSQAKKARRELHANLRGQHGGRQFRIPR